MITRRQTIGGIGALALAGAVVPTEAKPYDLSELTSILNNRFSGKNGRPYALCETGDAYLEFNLVGIFGENPYWTVDRVERALVDAWLKEFNEYAEERPYPSRLYWRTPIEFEWGDINGERACRIYSRLVLTERPELSEAELQSRLTHERNAIYDARTGEYVGDVRGLPA